MGGRFAVKRLVAVEIRPDRSNQHEFNAGRLHRGLGFDTGKISGRLRLLIYPEDGGDPIVDEDGYTLYDARARNPKRTEWHLYYYSKVLPELARSGDLLVLYRPEDGPDLHGVVLRNGSENEDRLLDALMLRNADVLAEFRLVDAPTSSNDRGPVVGEALARTPRMGPSETGYQVRDHPIVRSAIGEGAIPVGRVMAETAASIIGTERAREDPDGYLAEALETETLLFFEIETALRSAQLADLRQQEAPLDVMLDWAMAIHQARRSRRGQSLQNHFAAVLTAWEIPHTAQCATERGETPDFVVPSCDAYHDTRYPAERLRMVACKTTSKERWRQILNEAERIADKYLLTLDRRLTAAVIYQMNAARLLTFLPASIITTDYSTNPERGRLRSIRDLVAELRIASTEDA